MESKVSHRSSLVFYVNGAKVVDSHVDPSMTLLAYLRRKLRLTGTKLGCGEGGCGACTVMVSKYDRSTKNILHYSVNACLAPVCSMHGLAVTTVEALGSVRTGLHPAQERLAKAHGSQCGFCTPGIVMSMYTMLRNGVHLNGNEAALEDGFQGNLCRCTGYRAILQGYKTFLKPTIENGGCCGNPDKCCRGKAGDNETVATEAYSKEACSSVLFDPSQWRQYDPTQEHIFPPELQVEARYDEESLYFEGELVKWFRPTTLAEMASLKAQYPLAKIAIGNTELTIEMKLKHLEYSHIICATHIRELNEMRVDEKGVVLGASATLDNLERMINSLQEQGKYSQRQLGAFLAFQEMLRWFAGPQIRNVASIGGNIMTASPISDLNPVFMASKAQLHFLNSSDMTTRVVSMDANFFTGYRKVNIRPEEVLLSVTVPFLNEHEHICAFKQAHRREDDIAIVNAGMYVRFQANTDKIEEMRLSFGGMAPTTVLATTASSTKFSGRSWNHETLEEVLQVIQNDLPLKMGTPGGSEIYRMSLTLSFFYRFYLNVASELALSLSDYQLSQEAKRDADSALGWIPREPSQATALYEMVPHGQENDDPVGRPLIHTSALKQATGEAKYTDDFPQQDGELYMGLVFSEKAHAKVLSVDYSAALAMPGVVGMADERDLPSNGNNMFVVTGDVDEKCFAAGEVTCRGMVIGVVVADTQEHAQRAAQAVRVTYEELPAVVTIEDAIHTKSFYRTQPQTQCGDLEEGFKQADRIIEDEVRIAGQEHFYLETQALVAKCTEEGEIEVLSSCQNHAQLQRSISGVLGIPCHRITVRVKRLGGGFGGKETRWSPVSLPAAVCAYKFRRSVRCMLDRDEDMLITGTRHPALIKYKVGFTNEGRVTALDMQIYMNAGNTSDLSLGIIEIATLKAYNAYAIPNARIRGVLCMTNLASNTAFRGFGMPQGMFGMENALIRVADELGLPQEKVRELNMLGENYIMPYDHKVTNVTVGRCWNEVLQLSDFAIRRQKCDDFNKTSRWKKRGIAMTPLMYGVSFDERCLNQGGALINIYLDGSVLLHHGGNEMGQGLHTKMIQVASRALGLPADKFHTSETNTDNVPNTISTAASFSTDLNGRAIIDACEKLNERLKPIKDANPGDSWEQIVKKAFEIGVNLSATGRHIDMCVDYNHETGKGRPFAYYTYGAACSEVEIDCLTGDHIVKRSDIIMDLGKSVNPAIDIGQIEGGFMQGYGLYVLEEPRVSPTGVVYTRGPGMYKLPGFRDIPERLNVHLLKGSYCEHVKSVYSSKAVGEPPLLLAFSVFMAIRDAIKSARSDAGHHSFFRLDSPASAERIRLACQDQFTERFAVPAAGTYTPWDVQL